MSKESRPWTAYALRVLVSVIVARSEAPFIRPPFQKLGTMAQFKISGVADGGFTTSSQYISIIPRFIMKNSSSSSWLIFTACR
jgi:hypothetical protein